MRDAFCGKQRVEPAGPIQGIEIVAATNMSRADEDLRHGGASVGALDTVSFTVARRYFAGSLIWNELGASASKLVVALGVLGGSSFEERGETLAPGERLFLFTDGITEAFDPEDREYGEPRLESFLLSHHHLVSPGLIDAVREDVLAFCGPARPRDDMTLMLVERA